MGGNALSESLVFGALAARAATEDADSAPTLRRFQSIAEEMAHKRFNRHYGERRKISMARSLMDRLGRILWEKAGIIRDEGSLKESINEIDGILRELEGQRATRPSDLCRMLECRNAAISGRAIAVSALKRTESRGSHYRKDFPEETEDGLKHIYVRLNRGTPEISRVVPI
jgi:NADH-dependent fumarate reductase subunit A